MIQHRRRTDQLAGRPHLHGEYSCSQVSSQSVWSERFPGTPTADERRRMRGGNCLPQGPLASRLLPPRLEGFAAPPTVRTDLCGRFRPRVAAGGGYHISQCILHILLQRRRNEMNPDQRLDPGIFWEKGPISTLACRSTNNVQTAGLKMTG